MNSSYDSGFEEGYIEATRKYYELLKTIRENIKSGTMKDCSLTRGIIKQQLMEMKEEIKEHELWN